MNLRLFVILMICLHGELANADTAIPLPGGGVGYLRDFPQFNAPATVPPPPKKNSTKPTTIFIYFAADNPTSTHASSEAPLCYKFQAVSLEDQLGKLKAKYPNLYDDQIIDNPDGSRSLGAKRKDNQGNEITYFYSTSPQKCNQYQEEKRRDHALPGGLPELPAAEQRFEGKCLLEVHQKKYLNGPCEVSMESDGGFTIGASETKPITYFAIVEVTGKNRAEGFWNEEEGATHAHTSLGDLVRQGACWQNAQAKVCAWKADSAYSAPATSPVPSASTDACTSNGGPACEGYWNIYASFPGGNDWALDRMGTDPAVQKIQRQAETVQQTLMKCGVETSINNSSWFQSFRPDLVIVYSGVWHQESSAKDELTKAQSCGMKGYTKRAVQKLPGPGED